MGDYNPNEAAPRMQLYLQWCWFEESTHARPVGEIVNHRREFDPTIPACIDEMTRRANLCVDALANALAGKKYLLGDQFSAADIITCWTLYAHERQIGRDAIAPVEPYYRHLMNRPTFQSVLATEAAMH